MLEIRQLISCEQMIVLQKLLLLTIRCGNTKYITKIQISNRILYIQYENYRISRHNSAGKLL